MKPTAPTLAAVLAALALACQSSPSEQDPEQQFRLYKETALAHWNNNDMLRAQSQALKGLEIEPEDRELRLLVGWAKLVVGTRDDLLLAHSILEEQQGSDDYRAWLGLATVKERIGLGYADAARDFRAGRRFAKDDAQLKADELDAKAQAYWADSVALYEQTLAKRPDERQAIRGIQRVEAYRGDFAKSTEWSEKLLELTGAELTFFRRQLSREDLSLEAEDRLRKNEEDIVRVQIATRELAAKGYHELGEYERALEHLTRIIELDPNRAHTYGLRAQMLHLLGRYGEAIADLDQFLRLSEHTFDHPDVRRAYELRAACERAPKAG